MNQDTSTYDRSVTRSAQPCRRKGLIAKFVQDHSDLNKYLNTTKHVSLKSTKNMPDITWFHFQSLYVWCFLLYVRNVTYENNVTKKRGFPEGLAHLGLFAGGHDDDSTVDDDDSTIDDYDSTVDKDGGDDDGGDV